MCSCRPRYGLPRARRNARETELRRPPRGGYGSSSGATRPAETAATVGSVAVLKARSLVFDTAVAAVALAMSLGAMGHGGWNRDRAASGDHRLDALGVALALAMAPPLVARRIWPVPVLAVGAPATGALYALDYGFPPVAFAVALYTVACWPDATPPAVRNGVLAGSVAVLLVPSLVRHGFGPGVFAGTVVCAVAWFAGDRVRQRRERIAAAAERSRQKDREAERERRLASAEERTRIARDLHDSAGHAVNVILVQAGAARLLLEQDPARSRAALETIEVVARETLEEIDQLVRALRDPASTDGRGASCRARGARHPRRTLACRGPRRPGVADGRAPIVAARCRPGRLPDPP
jgi:signal transduction histidine kinase